MANDAGYGSPSAFRNISDVFVISNGEAVDRMLVSLGLPDRVRIRFVQLFPIEDRREWRSPGGLELIRVSICKETIKIYVIFLFL